MHAYFFHDVGKRHVFVLYGLGGAGKSQISFKFIEECQFDAETSRYVASISHSCVLELKFVLFFIKVFGRVFH